MTSNPKSKPKPNYSKLLGSSTFNFLRANKYFPFTDDIINIIFTYYTPPSIPFSSLDKEEREGILRSYNTKQITNVQRFISPIGRYGEWKIHIGSYPHNVLPVEKIKDFKDGNLNDYLISEIYDNQKINTDPFLTILNYIALSVNGHYMFVSGTKSSYRDDVEIKITLIICADFLEDIYLYVAPALYAQTNRERFKNQSEMTFIDNYDYGLKYLNLKDINVNAKVYNNSNVKFSDGFLYILNKHKNELKLERLYASYFTGILEYFIFRSMDGSWIDLAVQKLSDNYSLFDISYYPSLYSLIAYFSYRDRINVEHTQKFRNYLNDFQMNLIMGAEFTI